MKRFSRSSVEGNIDFFLITAHMLPTSKVIVYCYLYVILDNLMDQYFCNTSICCCFNMLVYRICLCKGGKFLLCFKKCVSWSVECCTNEKHVYFDILELTLCPYQTVINIVL
ncbi:hypothetical protein NP493_5g08035 [Ridgeia piscesae]|uniref:Uncharacterized protein n=1 Tax=Ridgeia piscesae TaxID=27915 RepID=A0AAD9PFK8_RIDPI|nr:hypothetical protein NP493_5g08035 [Ridgeia piscesae]